MRRYASVVKAAEEGRLPAQGAAAEGFVRGGIRRVRDASFWRKPLWVMARLLWDRAPWLAQPLAKLRRRMMPGLYVPGADGNNDETTASLGDESLLPPLRRDGAGVVHYIGSLQAGGAERQLVYTLAGLRERGVSTGLVVSEGLKGGLGHYLPHVQKLGVEVRWAGERVDPAFARMLAEEPALREAFGRVPLYLRSRVTEAAAEFRLLQAAVVHCWLDHTNVWGGVAARIAGVPHVILSTRNVSPLHMPHLMAPWFLPWYRWLAAQPGVRLVNNSRAGAEDYAAWLGLPAERFQVILNGVDFSTIRAPQAAEVEEARRAVRHRPGRRLVVGVFRLADEKQPLVFVEVMRQVMAARPEVDAAILGTGVLVRQVKSRIRALGLSRRFHLLGRRSDVPAFLTAADLMLLTSKAEGTPNVLLEAQHLRCPPVSTRAGGAVDAILDGRTGFLADVGDVPALVSQVQRLLDDEPLRRSMASCGPEFVRERFGLARMIDETEALYGSMDPEGAWRRGNPRLLPAEQRGEARRPSRSPA